jgi:hypothetical protein
VNNEEQTYLLYFLTTCVFRDVICILGWAVVKLLGSFKPHHRMLTHGELSTLGIEQPRKVILGFGWA